MVHFISGITIYRIYEPKNIPGFGTFDNANLYSLVYNGSYMLPNMLLALAIAAVLYIPLKKYFAGQDIRK
ncbi:MAG: energy-coupled thiamine transporter ThiT [Oscillospiraceae bacterium]